MKDNVLQGQVGPWSFTTEHGPVGEPKFKNLFGYGAGYQEQMQEGFPLKPVKLSAFLEQIPVAGTRWIATSLTIKIQMLVQAAAVYEGSILVIEGFVNQLKTLEERLTAVKAQFTAQKEQVARRIFFAEERYKDAEVEKRFGYEINGATAEYWEAIGERQNLERELIEEEKTIALNKQRIEHERETYLISGAQELLKTVGLDTLGGLAFNVSVLLTNGRTIRCPLSPPTGKLLEGIETQKISGTVGGEETRNGGPAGRANGVFQYEWNETIELLVPIYISDGGQPAVVIELNRPLQLEKRVAPKHGGVEQYAEGVFPFVVAMGIPEMFFNYQIDKETA